MQETLQRLLDETPGATGVILMGFDGIAIDQVAADDATFDIEAMAMEFSFRFNELREAAKSLELGDLVDVTLKAEHGTVLVRLLGAEHFAAVLLSDPRQFGKGRYNLRRAAVQLASDLA
jgi:predicted regulator of Ras-like GTPase activity (Roadblock/LC7/MglB family)